MGGVPPHQLAPNLVEAKAEAVHTLTKHLFGHPGLGRSIGPGVGQRAQSPVPCGIRDGDLQELGSGGPSDPSNPDPVGAIILEVNGGEIRHHVGCDIGPGISHLVDNLLRHGGLAHPTPRTLVLGNHKLPGGVGFDDGEAHLGQVGNRPPLGHGVPAAGLGATLVDVSRHHAGSQPVHIIQAPAELVDHGGVGEGGVGGPAGEDHLGPLLQQPNDGLGPHIDVGAPDLIPHQLQGLSGIDIGEGVTLGQDLVQAGNQAIPHDHPHPEFFLYASPIRSLQKGLGTSNGIHAPGVRHHSDPPLHDPGKDAFHEGDEVPGISRRGIPVPLLLHDGHGNLRQVVHHEVVDGSPFYLANRGIQIVAPEALTGSDSERGIPHSLSPCGKGDGEAVGS